MYPTQPEVVNEDDYSKRAVMKPDGVLQSYHTRSADLVLDPAESELGQKNDQHDIRTIITNREVKSIGLSVVGEVQRVVYGFWNGGPACLLAMKFYFRLADRRSLFDRFEISISFKKSASSAHENAEHPIVRCLTPCKVYGCSSVKRRARRWQVQKLTWDNTNRANVTSAQPVDAGEEQDTSIIGRAWVPSRRERPHQAIWTVTNDAKDGNWPLLDELSLSVVVEHEGHFEANVTISGDRSNRRLARILSPSWWSKDDPLLFNGITHKGSAPRTPHFNELNEEEWLQITPFSEFCPKPKAHSKRDIVYRVRGIPVHYGKVETQMLLCSVCKISADMIVVGSIATSLHRDEKVATVSFHELPSVFDEARDEWTFEFALDTRSQDSSDTPVNADSKVLYLLIDTHFKGFTPLSPFKSQSEHKMDIIAVSGLGGHAFGSFKQKGEQYMWLRDSLPGDLDGARVIVYGHDSQLSNSSSFQNISAIAGQLRSGLRSIRSFDSGTSPKIPLIFIGHSLGGLLIKRILVAMAKGGDDSDRANLTSTYGALFFGTPNQGMNIESLLAMVGDQPNRYLLETLGKGSEVLQNLMSSFNEVFTFEDSEIISFYETKKSKGALKVGDRWRMEGPLEVLVDIDSATQGRSWENTDRYIEAMNRDHSNLVKFQRNDEDYERVLGHLRRFFRQAMTVVPKRFE